MKYVQRRFYLPLDMYTQLSWLARSEGKTVTEKLRELVGDRLRQKKTKGSMQRLLELAREARKSGWKGPKDWSINHDKYFVEAYDQLKK